MAHYVFLSLGITSCLNQCFHIAEVLKARGHRVTFVSADENARGQVDAQGHPFVHLAEEHALNVRKRTAPAEQGGARRYLRWRAKRALERAHSEAFVRNRELDRILADLAPDLVLVDYELHGPTIRTAALGYRMMLIEHHCSPLRIDNIPIHSSHRIPTGRTLNTVRIRLEWQAALLKRQLYFRLLRLYYGGHDWWSTLKKIAHAYGFEWNRETSRGHWQFLTYRNIPTLYASPWELDFPHEIPNREFYVGPLVSVGRTEASADPRAQEILRTIDACCGADSRRPLIYCAMGTISSNVDYLRRVLQAFELHPEWELLMAAGRGVPLEHLRPVPSNVHLVQYAPQLEVLGRAQLMLTHAGPATLFECIHFGIPMVVYSTGFLEQNGNAARIEFHGLGLRGDLRKDTPDQIAQRIRRVLDDPSVRENLKGMQQICRAYQDANKVVELLEKRLTSSSQEMGWRPIRG